MFYDPIMSALQEEPEFEESPGDGGTVTVATFVSLSVGLLLAFAATNLLLEQ